MAQPCGPFSPVCGRSAGREKSLERDVTRQSVSARGHPRIPAAARRTRLLSAPAQASLFIEEPRILVISPVRNEAAHIERVVRAVAAQDVPPARWIVVDDESDDGTLEILRRLEAEFPFMTVLHTGDMPLAPVKDRLAVAA